ncbi:MAG: DNA polymerase IV [Bacteroidales bacterium]|nr:DNA polymerase IV [Bacteroidales bacterium]
MIRTIFHIDVNSAFLSWSAVKMISQGQPDVRLVPAVVSGDPEDRRSIVTAKSIPAKKYGINTAEPLSMALRKCPDLVVVHSDFAWYRECSRGFIAICKKYSPVLQQFSIDECFLDMTFRLSGKDPVDVARELKDEIFRTLGFTVNVGVAHNKLLAKMASDFEKPDKVHTLWEDEIPSKMWPLPVRDLLWVGKQTEAKLTSYGIKTIGELAKTPQAYLSRMLGDKFGHQIHLSANGIDDSPVVTEADEPKSYSNEHTLPKDVTDPEQVDRILFNLACHVCYRIRRDNFYAKGVSVFVKDKDFHTVSRQGQMPQHTNVTALILFAARGLLSQIWTGGTPIRQVGLGVFNLSHESIYQLSLFEDEKMDYYRKWDEEYDRTRPIKGRG